MPALLEKAHRFLNTDTYKAKQRQDQLVAEESRQYLLALETEMKAWMRSDLGTYFFEHADADKKKAIEDLIKTDAADINRVRSLQSRIQMLDTINAYFSEVLLKARIIRETK